MLPLRTTAVTVAALVAFALGGAALAGAAANDSSKPTSSSSGDVARPQREPLSSDIAAKVKAAALAKVPGATVLRTEAGGPYSSAYHAHVRTSAGALQAVLVSSSFQATRERPV